MKFREYLEESVLNNKYELKSLVERIAIKILYKKLGKTGTIKDIDLNSLETELFNHSDYTGALKSEELKSLTKLVMKMLPKIIEQEKKYI